MALANLAACGVFAGLGLDRRAALWAAGVERAPAGLLPGLAVPEESAELPPMSVADELAEDYRVLDFSARHGHVLGLYRAQLRARRVRTAAELADLPSGATAQVAGLVTIVQPPPTANGMCFVTLEDESGLADLVLRPPVARRSRALLAECPLVLAAGRVQRAHGVTNLQVTALKPLGMRVGAAGLTPATARRLYR